MDLVMTNANPASTCKEETLASTLYKETGPMVAERRVRAAQEEVKSSVLNISNCQERGEK